MREMYHIHLILQQFHVILEGRARQGDSRKGA